MLRVSSSYPAACFSCFLLCAAGVPPDTPETPDLAFLVYDFAGLEKDIFQDLQRNLQNLLFPAGVSVAWVDCGNRARQLNHDRCQAPQRTDIYLRLINGRDVKSLGLHRDVLGLMEPAYAGRGLITILVHNVASLQTGSIWQLPVLLAHAIAHEIGHLVAGLDHRPAGMMSTNWTRVSLRWVTQPALAFTAPDIRALQEAIERRRAAAASARPGEGVSGTVDVARHAESETGARAGGKAQGKR